jgi:hypothetical protein
MFQAPRAASAAPDGAAAVHRKARKRRAYSLLAPNRHTLVPFLAETYGRLGRPTVVFLGTLGGW